MVNGIEQRIYELVRSYAGTCLFNIKKVELTPETDLDTDMKFDVGESEELMDEFFREFQVDRANFIIETYYPDEPISWNPFRKLPLIPVPDFTIGMLIESAKAGYWLYD